MFSIRHKAIDDWRKQFTGATYRTVIETENENSDFLLAKQGGNQTRESVAHDLIDRLVVMFSSVVSQCGMPYRIAQLLSGHPPLPWLFSMDER